MGRQERAARDLRPRRRPCEVEEGRGDVREDPIVEVAALDRAADEQERHGVQRVRRHGRPSASRISSALPWSAVMARSAPGASGSAASHRLDRADDAVEAAVDDLEGGDGGVPVAGVADHVRVGVVGHDHVAGAALDRLDEGVGDGGGAHRGFEVVRRDMGARDEPAVLARVGVSPPPLKKYVTWAYFSVSARWSWRKPASDQASASDRASSGGKATATGRPALVVGHRRHAGGQSGPAGRRARRDRRSRTRVGEGVGRAVALGRRGSWRG